MDTILINCSMDKAKVQDGEGRFLNEVSQGIVVNKGDRVSLEGIAVNSSGVGTNVIEVPKTIKEWIYQPNSIELEVSFYIHHNYKFTIQAPLGITNGSSITNIYPAGTAQYGYMNKADPLLGGFINELKTSDLITQAYEGMKFYVMGIPNADPSIEEYTQGALPYTHRYTRTKSRMKLEVPIGYDSPQNIADTLTTQLHKANPVPLNTITMGTVAPNQSFFADILTTTHYEEASFTLGNGATRIVPANWSANLVGIGDENPFYSCFAAANPSLWEYGSQLLNAGDTLKYNTAVSPPFSAGVAYNTDVYNCYDLDIDAGGIDIGAGYILTTTIAWDWENVSAVAEFIHSQKLYYGVNANTETMKTSPLNENFTSQIQLGRTDDTLASPIALVSPCYLPVAAGYDANPNVCFLKTHSFYNQSDYDAKYLGANAIVRNAVICSDGVDGSPILTDPNTGLTYPASSMAQFVNANLIPVKTDGVNEYSIGIILTTGHATGAVKPAGRNYCLIDLGFNNSINPCVYLVNPEGVAGATGQAATDYIRNIQLGSPNAALQFDGDKGRFYFSDLHWAKRVGNGVLAADAADPQASNTIITLNSTPTQFQTLATPNTVQPYLEYAQSGIGLENVGLYTLKTNEVDYLSGSTYGVEKQPDDWKNCLMGRMGFDYNQLFSKYGMSYAIFNPLYYETTIPTLFPYLFPTPLTTNPQLDTSQALGLSCNVNSLPMYNLSTEGEYPNINLTCSSAQIYANNLPNKLVYPYWLVYSDIINGINFHSVEDGEQDNIIAVCNRAYISGDFAFSFATDYTFTATKDYVISGITTQILNPDLSPANVDEKTSVIYKIQKPIPMFQTNSNQSNKPKNAVDYDIEQKRKGDSHREGHKRNKVVDRSDVAHISTN